MRNKKFISLLLGCVMCSSVTTGMVLSANADGGATEHTITINLGDGFMWDSTASVAKEDTTVTYTTSAETITFTHDVVQSIFDYPVYGKISNATYDPSTKSNTLSSMLFGLTDGETVWQSGDTLTVTGDMTLDCYYDKTKRYSPLTSEQEVELHRPDATHPGDGFSGSFTARDLQPFYHALVQIQEYGFRKGTTAIELPETVEVLGGEAVPTTVYEANLENVRIIKNRGWQLNGEGHDLDAQFVHVFKNIEVFGESSFTTRLAGTQTRKLILAGAAEGADKSKVLRGSNSASLTGDASYMFYKEGNDSASYTGRSDGGEILNVTDPRVHVYVPYGETAEWYINETDYAKSSFKPSVKEGTLRWVNIPMREMHTVSFDLNGGTVAGKTTIADTYMDARAVSVTREGAEANLFEQGDTTGYHAYNPSAQTLKFLKAEKPADPVKAGCTFIGWQDASGYVWTDEDWTNGGKSGYTTGNVELTAKFETISKVSITYVNNNGTSDTMVDDNDANALVTKPADPSKQYYTFAGWYKDSACTQAFDFATELCPSDDFSLYAKWTANQMSTKLVVNGGTLTTSSIITKDGDDYNISYAYDLGVATLPVPVKDNYTFDGWYLDANFETRCEAIAANTADLTTLYAKFSATMRKVTYVLDGGVLDGEKTFDEYQQGTTFTLPTPTKTGYTFEGWYYVLTVEDSKVTSVNETEDVTVYAKWSEETTNPGEGENPNPGEGENPNPGEGENPNPGEGENPNPGEGENPNPGDGVTSDTNGDKDDKSGCFGSIGSLGVVGLVGLLSVAGVALKSKKDEE